ncbi:MAG: hypothetical protein LBD09_04780 [Treponema sp.]|jgi:hypothetical protein|nr:hypothetical protein [Treponema sp.]
MKQTAVLAALILGVSLLGAEPLYSPTWGFRLDLPEGYELAGGDAKNQFSFESSFGGKLDLSVYTARASAGALADELGAKLSNRGQKHLFTYNGRETALVELRFSGPRNARFSGWALCLELEKPAAPGSAGRPLLAAIAYGPEEGGLEALHLSALDSIEGGLCDRRLPGAVTEFRHPRGGWNLVPLANSAQSAWFRENDAAAAQAVVDREFEVMKRYTASPRWQEAWKRFYRAIFKDSFDRLESAAFMLERSWNNAVTGPSGGGVKAEEAERLGKRGGEAAGLASTALAWVQGFAYERDLMGSDFVNLVTAAREGRGDCDSRAMLWAIILEQANISAGIMVSRDYSHAMGLADLEGGGARFPMKDGAGKEVRWLVAETTASVALGQIGQTVSDVGKWLGIVFD